MEHWNRFLKTGSKFLSLTYSTFYNVTTASKVAYNMVILLGWLLYKRKILDWSLFLPKLKKLLAQAVIFS